MLSEHTLLQTSPGLGCLPAARRGGGATRSARTRSGADRENPEVNAVSPLDDRPARGAGFEPAPRDRTSADQAARRPDHVV